jgi:hypothetical protein
MAAHNGLVGGSSPLSPTTQSGANGDFLKYRKMPAFGGVILRPVVLWSEGFGFQRPFRGLQGLFWRLCLCLEKSRFPETETWFARDRFEYGDAPHGGGTIQKNGTDVRGVCCRSITDWKNLVPGYDDQHWGQMTLSRNGAKSRAHGAGTKGKARTGRSHRPRADLGQQLKTFRREIAQIDGLRFCLDGATNSCPHAASRHPGQSRDIALASSIKDIERVPCLPQ